MWPSTPLETGCENNTIKRLTLQTLVAVCAGGSCVVRMKGTPGERQRIAWADVQTMRGRR